MDTGPYQRPRWQVAVTCCVISLALPLLGAAAQVIPVKTVAVNEGDQFGFLPSAKAAMAISIAMPDSTLDPFHNPATAARLTRGFVFASPAFYSLTHDGGQGSTLPLGAIVKHGSTFGGAGFAVQEIGPTTHSAVPNPAIEVLDAAPTVFPGGSGSTPRRRVTNRYGYVMLGQTLPANVSVAASAFLSQLNGLEGADLLYAGSQGLTQTGSDVALRFGLLKRWNGDRSLEAVAIHDRTDLTHDVSYFDGSWDPATRSIQFLRRTEHNADRAELVGGQLTYRQAVGDSGWYVGGIFTANRSTHPVMPSLGSMTLTREPGTSSAFNIGTGISRTRDRTTVGIDGIYEPIWGHTSQTGQANDDRFHFSNLVGRGGVSHEQIVSPSLAVRYIGGIQRRSVRYRLDQLDSTQTPQSTTDHWNEWTHSFGVSFVAPSVEVHCVWRLVSGTGRPTATVNPFSGSTSPFLPMRTFTEQFSITVPIR